MRWHAENKRKMEALNLRHLSASIKEAPKTPSPMKQKRRRIVERAVVVPSSLRRSRRVANLPAVKYAEAKQDLTDITHKVYFDIEIDGKPAGRIVMGLFGMPVRLFLKQQESSRSMLSATMLLYLDIAIMD